MAIVFDAPVAITPVANIPNTWTDIVTLSPKVLGPVQLELTVDNQSGSVTNSVEIQILSDDGVLGFGDQPVGGFLYRPGTVNAERVPGYVIPGSLRRVKVQARSAGATDQYTVSGSYGTIDVNA